MTSTATSTVVPVVSTDIVTAYRAADAKGKGKIRASLNAARDAATDSLDIQALVDIRATLAACTSTTRSEKKVTDYGQVVAQRIVDLRAAADALESGDYLPEGVDSDRMSAPTSTPLADALATAEPSSEVARIASAKVTRSDLRRSIQAVYERAFDAAEESEDFDGFLTTSEIANLGAIEGYRPSVGAVAARVTKGADDCTLDGFTPAHNEEGTLGAERV